MTNWTPILYRDFWDVPRMFLVEKDGRTLLFDCAFDEETEDYPDFYRVYEMSKLASLDLEGSWAHFPSLALADLGEIPIDKVRFDATSRKLVDASVLAPFLEQTRSSLPGMNGHPPQNSAESDKIKAR